MWPTTSDFSDAIHVPRVCFTDAQLQSAEPLRDRHGMVTPIRGALAAVFPMTIGGSRFAVRCPLRDVPDVMARYAAVSNALATQGAWAVGFEFQADGIAIGGRRYPITKMEWVDGKTLHVWLALNVQTPTRLLSLARQFFVVYSEMRAGGIAHGDLSHGNVMVTRTGEIRLVDYDAMYVPALAGRPSWELGHRNYQHPDRTAALYGPDLDNFSAWVIYGSLIALAHDSSLWAGNRAEHLVIADTDFRNLATSPTLTRMRSNSSAEVRLVAAAWDDALSKSALKTPPLAPLLNEPSPPRPHKPNWYGHRASGEANPSAGDQNGKKWYQIDPGAPPTVEPKKPWWADTPRTSRSRAARLVGELRYRSRQTLALAASLALIGTVVVYTMIGHHQTGHSRAQAATTRSSSGVSEPGSSPSTPSNSGTTPELTPGEQGLMAHLPAQLQGKCVSNAQSRLKGALVSVTCTDGPVYATFDQFPTSQAMYARYQWYETGYRLTNGWCGDKWRQSSPYGLEGQDIILGDVMCYYGQHNYVWMDWTNTKSRIYGYATRDDGNAKALFAWWDNIGSNIR